MLFQKSAEQIQYDDWVNFVEGFHRRSQLFAMVRGTGYLVRLMFLPKIDETVVAINQRSGGGTIELLLID